MSRRSVKRMSNKSRSRRHTYAAAFARAYNPLLRAGVRPLEAEYAASKDAERMINQGKVPLSLLERRLRRLSRVVRSRGGKIDCGV